MAMAITILLISTSYSLQTGRPRFKRIRAQSGTGFRAMERKKLIPSARQYPASMFGENAGRNAGLMCQIVTNQCQTIAIIRKRVLRYGSVLLANEQRSCFGRIIDGRAAGRHVLAYRWPILAAVAFQPHANRSEDMVGINKLVIVAAR